MASNDTREFQLALEGDAKVGKLYRLSPSAIVAESVDFLDPETGEVIWPINPWQIKSPWWKLETTPLLLVKIQACKSMPTSEKVLLRLADIDKTEHSFLFRETIVTVMLEEEKEFLRHFYEVSGT